MKQTIVVFDNAPSQPSAWMKDVCQASKLFLVEQDKIGAILGPNPEFQKAFNKDGILNPTVPHQSLVPFYRDALKQHAGTQPRLAMHGWGWLVYAPSVDACVFDFTGIEAERKKAIAGQVATEAQIAEHFEKVKNILRDAAKQKAGLTPDKILELPADATDEKKKGLVQAFLQKLRI